MKVTLVPDDNEETVDEELLKIVVLGLLKRNGKVYAQIIPDASREEIFPSFGRR